MPRDETRSAEPNPPRSGWPPTGPISGPAPPNITERGRAAGIHQLCQGLLAQGLTTAELFDAQGTFDVDAFRSRVQVPILAWLDGQHTPPADFMPPAALGRHYEVLVAAASEHQDLRPHIALAPGPAWFWHDFCT